MMPSDPGMNQGYGHTENWLGKMGPSHVHVWVLAPRPCKCHTPTSYQCPLYLIILQHQTESRKAGFYWFNKLIKAFIKINRIPMQYFQSCIPVGSDTNTESSANGF